MSQPNMDATFSPTQGGLSSNNLSTSRMSDMHNDLSSTLQSFRDSLAFSFQTLNLTLSSLNNSIRVVGSKLSVDPKAFQNPPQYVAANQTQTYYGGLSRGYADFAGNQSFMGMLFANNPYNVSPMEYWLERQREMPMRISSGAASFLGSAAEMGAYAGGASLGGRVLGGALGVSNGIGRMFLGAPVGIAVSTAANLVLDPMVQAAQVHNRDVSAIRRMSPRFRSMFSLQEAQTAARGIEDLAYQETFDTNSLMPRLNMSGFRDVTMMGLQGNMFQGTTPEELVKQVATAGKVVKFLTGVMGNKDVQETMQTVKQLKDMGLNLFQVAGVAQSLGGDAFKYGKAMGVDPSSLMNSAMNMSAAAYGQFGNPAFVGIQPTMRNIAYLTELEKRRMLTPAEVAAGGGITAMSGRMASAQAALLNSGGTGMPMLLTGMQGTTFSMASFNQAAQGDYFSMIGASANKLLSGGIGSMVDFYMNKNNIIAGLGETGQLDEVQRTMLKKQLDLAPGMNDSSLSPTQKVNLAAMTLKKMMEGIGNPIDDTTAKSMAMSIYRPSTLRRAENNADEQYRQGILEYQRAQNGPGRPIEYIGEQFERLGSAIHNNLILRPARAVADTVARSFDGSLESRGFGRDLQYSSGTSATYKWAMRNINNANPELADSMYSAEDYVTAWERTNSPNSPFSSIATIADYFTGNRQNALVAGLSANSAIRNAAMWNRITSEDRISDVEAMRINRDLLRDNVSIDDVRKVMEDFSDNNTAEDPLLGASEALIRLGNGVVQSQAAARADFWDKQGYDDVEMLKRIYGSDFINSNLKNGKLGIDADTLLVTRGNEESVRVQLEQVARDANARSKTNIFTADIVQGILANRYAAGDKKSMSLVYASGNKSKMEALAEATASTRNADRWAIQEGLSAIDISVDKADALLSELGISPDTMTEFINGASDKEKDALFKVLDAKSAQGSGAGALSETELKNLGADSITSKQGIALLSRVNQMDSRELRSAAQGALGRYDAEGKVGSWTKDALVMKIKSAYPKALKSQLNNLGFRPEDYQVKDMMADPSSFINYISKTDAVTEEGAQLKSFVSKLNGMSLEELDSEVKRVYGNNFDTKGKTREDLIVSIAQAGLEGSSDQVAANKSKVAEVRKSAIDTAVDTSTGEPAVRVKLVGSTDFQEIRDGMEKDSKGNKADSNPQQNGLTLSQKLALARGSKFQNTSLFNLSFAWD